MQQLLSSSVNQRALASLLTPFYFLFQSKKLLLRLAMLVMSVGMMSGVVGQATVKTDKDDYAPGEYVIITGTGWQPGEKVDFHFEETPKPATCVNSHDNFAIADANGNVFYNGFLIKENHIGVSFVLTATGLTSGLKAVTYFTDATWNLEVSTNGGSSYLSNTTSASSPTIIFDACQSRVITFRITQTNGSRPNLSYSIALPIGFTISVPSTVSASSSKQWSASQVANHGINSLCIKASAITDALANNESITFTATVISGADIASALLKGRAQLGPQGQSTPNFDCIDPDATSGGQLINERPSFSSTSDNVNPTITAPSAVSANTNTGCTATGVALGTPVTGDNCTVASVTNDAPSAFPLGETIVTWTVTDGSGNKATATQKVTVTNTAPVVSVTGPASPQQINTLSTITITHGDNNIVSATINWDDNSPAEVISNPGNPSFTRTHKYITPGVYTVTVTVADACGLTSTFDYKYVVIYDPNGGFVTGGGWFNSPACAFKNDLGLTGKANFGFVAKYKKGSTIPDGNTEFQFKAGDINFNSSAYDDMRLVIANHKANYTGTGKINGMGNYGFLVSGIDGQIIGGGGVDKFRIKIWDINDGNKVIYDNNCGNTDDNADPTTIIEGGSIVIHDPKKKTANRMEPGVFTLAPQDFNVKVLGNPSITSFRLQLQGSNMQEKFTVKVVDINGRLIEVQQNLYAGQVIELGSKYTQGTYFAEVTQGTNRKVVKLIKVSRD